MDNMETLAYDPGESEVMEHPGEHQDGSEEEQEDQLEEDPNVEDLDGESFCEEEEEEQEEVQKESMDVEMVDSDPKVPMKEAAIPNTAAEEAEMQHDSQMPEAMVEPVVEEIHDSQTPDDIASENKVDPKAEELGSDNDDAKGTFKAGIEEH